MAYQFDPRIIQQILAGIGTSLSAAGSGAPNWGLAGSQAIADTQRQQQADATGRLQMQIQQEALQRQRDQDAQQRQRDAQARTGLSRLLGQPDPNATAKFVGGAGSGASSFQQPAATTAQPSWLTPDVQSIMSGMDPNDAFAFAAKLATEKPDTSAPTTKDFNEGGNIVTKQWNPSTKSWDVLTTAPRWQAPQPPQMPGDYRIWLEDKKAHPEIAAFQTYRGWATYDPNKTAPTTYGDIVTGADAQKLGFDPKGAYQKGSDGKWYVTQAPEKAAVTYQTLSGDALKAVNPALDPNKTWKIGSDGSASVVDKPEKQAGDVVTGDAAQAIGLDPSGTYQKRPDGTYSVLQKPRAEGTYGGQGIDQQDSNIILKGQADDEYRKSPEYALAWTRQYLQPHIIQSQDPNDPTRTVSQAIMVPAPAGFKPPVGGSAAPNATQAQPPSSAGPSPVAQPAASPSPSPAAPTAIPIPGTGAPVKLNGEQALSKGFSERMESAEKVLADPKIAATGTSVTQSLNSSLPYIGNSLISADRQQLEQAEQNFINAQLRRESGAAISPSEFANARKQYFPQIGDGEAVLKQKAENRRQVIQAMKQSASPYPLPAAGGTSIDDLKKKFNITPVNP